MMGRNRLEREALEAELHQAKYLILSLRESLDEARARLGTRAPEAPLGGMRVASHLRAVYADGLYIDGAKIPWHITPDIEVQPFLGGISGATGVTVTFIVAGTVEVTDRSVENGRVTTPRVVDPVLGDMREYVRREFAQAFPWLRLPE